MTYQAYNVDAPPAIRERDWQFHRWLQQHTQNNPELKLTGESLELLHKEFVRKYKRKQ